MDSYKMRLERGIRHSVDTEPHEKDVAAVQSWVNDEQNWQSIKDLQVDKQRIVEELNDWRKKFWAVGPDGVETKLESLASHRLHADSEGHFVARVGEQDLVLTKGEVLSASEWGLWWGFDDSVSPTLQREVMTHQVHHALAASYDKQLMAFGSTDRLSDDRKRDAYASKRMQEASIETVPNGILAEKLLLSFLTKEMYDGELPFHVESVDVYEDIEHKIDFVITYKGASRGVKVEEPEHRIGIQFTLDPHAKDRKLEQLHRMKKKMGDTDVEDIILITMPLSHVRDVFDTWRYDQNNSRKMVQNLDPRGPDHLWSADIKQLIIENLVRNVGVR